MKHGIPRLRPCAATALLLLEATAVSPARAQTLCSAPIAPFCVDLASTYDDPGTIDRCRQDVEAFIVQLDDYAACLDRQVEELRGEQKTLEESFNCRAEGGQDCPQADSFQ